MKPSFELGIRASKGSAAAECRLAACCYITTVSVTLQHLGSFAKYNTLAATFDIRITHVYWLKLICNSNKLRGVRMQIFISSYIRWQY